MIKRRYNCFSDTGDAIALNFPEKRDEYLEKIDDAKELYSVDVAPAPPDL